ncbi:transposase family protein [Pseudomonas juntendi]|uniref:transposase family protein n=1 Tax=Pseudomonas juntendi TaxID=2666183 RepID=UPI00244B51E8|nr:transposase family protein [Pseudomonas juntendi]MDG9810090.1 transposase family protein [Pseudomonas juntendi]
MTDTSEDLWGALNIFTPLEEIGRHKVGSERFTVISLFIDGKISAAEGINLLGIGKQYFYKLVARSRGARNYNKLVPGKRGRKSGSDKLDARVEAIIDKAFDDYYYGISASYAKVWSVCQSEADAQKVVRPSYYTVRRRIKSKPPRLLYERKYGKDAAEQRYGARPGHKKTDRPLQWVQFDHTVMDILLVDENDRQVIIGRPWISLAICIHTRVVLGFYLSLLPPSAVSVAMLIENCVLPKNKILLALGMEENLWPVHGLMETIHTDNAKEFISDVLVLNCKHYGIDVRHRNVGKKHQGGHIESLIGKFMTTKVHFLPGTTGSNVIDRKSYSSEKRASMTFSALRKFMIYQVCAYHETKHSGIGKSPIEAWNDYYRDGVEPKSIPEKDHDGFRFSFYPEFAAKQVVPQGIELFRRFYYAPALKNHIREKVLVKYDPYNLDVIRVKVNTEWFVVPCVRNSSGRHSHYEYYRHQRRIKSIPNGTMTRRGSEAVYSANQLVVNEVKATTKARRLKKEKGLEQHNAYSIILEGASKKNNESAENYSNVAHVSASQVGGRRGLIDHSMPGIVSNLRSNNSVDYEDEPTLY